MKKQICSCGHHHEGECYPGFNIEGDDLAPAVVSLEKESENNAAELTGHYEMKLLQIEQWCRDQDALIGHLKLTLTTKEAALMLSSTGNGVQYLGNKEFPFKKTQKYTLNIAAIVYGISERELNALIRKEFKI